MERPTLHPSAHLEMAEESARSEGEVGRPKRGLLRRVVCGTVGGVFKVLFARVPLLTSSRPREGEEHSPVVRLGRGLINRLAAGCVLTLLVVATLVQTATHPGEVPTRADPSSLGLYFETVTVTAKDGVKSHAWLVPTLDAKKVLESKDDVLRETVPAVVLVHDQTFGPQQLLPYLRPLNEAGVVTLTISLRGAGTDDAAGRTFGLREAQDVAAAVAFLRARPTVDNRRIAVMGLGTGATAALIAAKADPAIHTVAAIDTAPDANTLLRPLVPEVAWLSFLRPMTRMAFEAAYDVNADEVELSRLTAALKDREVFYLVNGDGGPSEVARLRTVTHFLKSRLEPAAVADVEKDK